MAERAGTSVPQHGIVAKQETEARIAAGYVYKPRYEQWKRFFDVVISGTLLLTLGPAALVAALLIATTSPGPVILNQERVGRYGRRFRCYKFRTMIDGAHDLRPALIRDRQARGLMSKSPDDPRITRVGRFLRRTSIDEIPNLVSVLRGDMSIVGPRPCVPEELLLHDSAEDLIWLQVPPGITGLWQVSGRSLVDGPQRITLELEYVRRRGIWFDCLIVLRTIPAVLSGRGAF